MKKTLFKSLLLIFAALALAFASGCSAAIRSENDAAEFYSYTTNSKSEALFDGFSGGVVYEEAETENFSDHVADYEAPQSVELKNKDQRKIIYSSWFDISTEEYDKSVSALNALCERYDAYFESSESYGGAGETSNRRSNFTIRIPVGYYKNFIREAGSIGTVTGSGENNRDVTEEYFDTEARLESAKIREERLLEILKNADSLDDVLLLERELSDVRYEIENYSGTLKKYDSLVSYATATVNIREVKKVVLPDSEKHGLGARMAASLERGFDNFRNAFDNLLVSLTYSLPVFIFVWLPIIAVIVIIICVLSRKRKKRIALKKKAAQEKKDEIIDENK